MKARKIFEIGDIYFHLCYFEKTFIFPSVSSYVFVGNNLLGDEPEDTLYFQDCESYATGVQFPGNDSSTESIILGLTSYALDNMLDTDDLLLELRAANERRHAQSSR